MVKGMVHGVIAFFVLCSAAVGQCPIAITLQHAVDHAEWNHSTLQPEYEQAIKVLQIAKNLSEEGVIPISAFEFLLQRWQLWNEYSAFATSPLKMVPLLTVEGKLSELARSHFSKEAKKGGEAFTEGDLLKMEARIRENPADYLMACLSLPFFNNPAITQNSPHAMIAVIAQYGELSWLLRRTPIVNELMMCVASLPLNNLILRTKFGDDAVQLKFEFGVASLRSLLGDLENRVRPVGFFFPGTEVPEEADNILVNRTGFALHDIFHADLLSKVDPRYRLLAIRLFRESKRQELAITDKNTENDFFESLSSLAIDGVPRGAKLQKEAPFQPLKWLAEDLPRAYPVLLNLLLNDIETHPQWYAEHHIPLRKEEILSARRLHP